MSVLKRYKDAVPGAGLRSVGVWLACEGLTT